MKIGVQIPNFSYPGGEGQITPTLNKIIDLVDNAGFESLWVMDHYYQINNLFELPFTEPMMEAYSLLNYFAGRTERVKLGALVTGIIYRNPAFLIKQVSALDVLSQGRAYFGIGAAWYKEEAEGYGFPFPPVKERFELLEENLQIAQQMWQDGDEPFEGKHYKMGSTLNSPQSVQKPWPKILLGGMGEKKTLRMVAQYADACNLFAGAGNEVLGKKLEILKQHCEKLGRNYNDIEKTTLGTIKLMDGEQSVEDVITYFKELHEVGIEHAIVNLPNIFEITPLEILRDSVLPVIADL